MRRFEIELPALPRAMVLGLALVAAAATGVRAQDVGLPIGSIPAPAQVEDLDGGTVDMDKLIGDRPAVIEFWATWCPLCEALEPRLQGAKQSFGDRVDFIVVAVAVNQTPRRIQRHLEDHTLSGPVYYDRRGQAVRAFQAPTTSYVVILDAAGKVAYTGVGGDQPIGDALERILGRGPP